MAAGAVLGAVVTMDFANIWVVHELKGLFSRPQKSTAPFKIKEPNKPSDP